MMQSPAVIGLLVVLTAIGAGSQGKPASSLDSLLAPVALYPDQLLAQMLESSRTPARVKEFSGWLTKNKQLSGTALQDAAKAQGFEPSLVLLALFPKVVDFMAGNIDWTTQVGQAFASNRQGVFDSIQRLRANALKAGTLKDSAQQKIVLKETTEGALVITIQPANPQVVYVPQYNTQTVYTNPPPTTQTIVVQEEDDNSTEAAIAGAMVGFGVGIAIGAAVDNNYYYGPYGWYGGPAMYNDAWDDWYDDREDAREDWYENREDAREDYRENRQDLAEERTERRSNTQDQRTERQNNRGTSSDAFSGYSSGRSERAASSRGKSSRSRSSSGGNRSRKR